jgi:hypothetical protein
MKRQLIRSLESEVRVTRSLRSRLGVLLGALLAVSAAAPLFGETGNKTLVEITNTQQVPFQSGGTIRVDHSYGELWVEGWDRPEVELTVIKSPNELYGAKEQAAAAKRVENVKVSMDRKSDRELEIATAVFHFSRWTHPFGPLGGVIMKYRIRVPRNSKLVIHHGNGKVLVSQVVGDIEATGNRGDIVLLLPETQKYAINAKSKFGTLTCDFDGDFRHGLKSSSYTSNTPAPAHKIYVREGIGGIQIKGSPAEAQPKVAAGLQ